MHKVYLPQNARSSQYLLAELPLCNELLSHYPDLISCYQALSQSFFGHCQQQGLHHCYFIANDKVPVVRYLSEALTVQTQDQMLFFYNPAYHEGQQAYFDSQYRARKISLLLLSAGEEIRTNAAAFHSAVRRALLGFRESLPSLNTGLKLRDHQHIGYDLFARQKGNDQSYGYKMRAVPKRYESRDCQLPEQYHQMNYAAISLPFNRQLRQALTLEHDALAGSSVLVPALEQLFFQQAQAQQLKLAALVADGRTPLVRNFQSDKEHVSKELRLLSFDTSTSEVMWQCFWQPELCPDTVHLLLVADDSQLTEGGYARFLQRVEECMKQLTRKLMLNTEKQDVQIRFHQHISYWL
ncbi:MULTISPECIES: DUF3083 family protein [Rheinheimera]|uniref:DUF3083 family protein n=1 Tax=Rheinheimera marina TaxID=1774958 RepID=A0ABV9JJ32_9GAMM